MPKPFNKKQKLTEKINQLEEELKHLDDLERFEDGPRKPSQRSKSSRHFDSDSFDIERESGSSKRSKDVGNRSKKPEPKERDFKFQPSFRGRGRGGIIERGRMRGRGRGTIFRGSFKQFFRPKESSKSQESSSKQKSQDLYNDGEDWSRYVSKNVDRREKPSKDMFRDQETFPEKPKSTSKEVIKSRPESSKASQEDSKVDEGKSDDQDMFYFPPDSKEDTKVSEHKTNNESKSTPDTKPDVMNLFQELQAKLASSGANISGIDLIADTLKKLGEIQNQTKSVSPQNQQKQESTIENSLANHSDAAGKKNSGVSFSISTNTKMLKPVDEQEKKTEPNPESEMSSKKITSRPIKEIEKVMMDDIKEQRKIYEFVENKSLPLKVTSSRDSGDKDSPQYKRGSSPGYRKESGDYKRRESISPKHKGNSPSRRRKSPSPLYRRRRSPSPMYRRRRESISPSHKTQEPFSPTHKRRESPSPSHKRLDSVSSPPRGRESHTPPRKRESDTSPKRRDSKTPPRRRESNSPPRRRESKTPPRRRDSNTPPRRRDSKTPPRYREMSPSRRWRESEWYTRRSPKRRRSRSRSRSPRHYYRRRSSSFSPSRRYPYRKRRHSPSPDRRNILHVPQLGNTWYDDKKPTYLVQPPDPLQQPKPPGGESSDVYAEVSF